MAASALSCLGGDIVCRLWPRNDEERILAGDDGNRSYATGELCLKEVSVAITGITGGSLLDPVRYGGGWAETSSVILGARSRTIRRVTTRHQFPGPG